MINKDTLAQSGIASTRIMDLLKGCGSLHSAVCQLDPDNRDLLAEHFPEVLKVAQAYGAGCTFLNDLGGES
jgi:hypothetical protein